MSVAVFAFVLLVAADGHPLIQPVAQSVLIVSSQDDDQAMNLVYRNGNERIRKTVVGSYWSLEYELGNDLARDAIMAHFVAESERLQGVIRRELDNRLTFSVMREDGGETWCQLWATAGNYTLEIVDEPPPRSSFDVAPLPRATIVFARGSADVNDDAERTLDDIANWLEINRNVRFQVRGHRGPLEDPLLVEQRAAAVASSLLYRGVAEDRFTITEDATNQGFEATVVAVQP
jgi:hypothetical protein